MGPKSRPWGRPDSVKHEAKAAACCRPPIHFGPGGQKQAAHRHATASNGQQARPQEGSCTARARHVQLEQEGLGASSRMDESSGRYDWKASMNRRKQLTYLHAQRRRKSVRRREPSTRSQVRPWETLSRVRSTTAAPPTSMIHDRACRGDGRAGPVRARTRGESRARAGSNHRAAQTP